MHATLPAGFSGLEYLDSAYLLLDRDSRLLHATAAAHDLLLLRDSWQLPLSAVFGQEHPFVQALHTAQERQCAIIEHELIVHSPQGEVYVSLEIKPVEASPVCWLLEVRRIDQQRRIINEERLHAQQQANRELIRNLAHEIKNPLGGIRGAAQLLAHELPDPQLREYTSVIVEESQRLQVLLDRLLTPHRLPHLAELNIHEVLEHVRTLTLAETPNGLAIRRDYDTSLPELIADRLQLVQVVLNIVRNACQAMHGVGEIVLRTRIARQVTLNRRRFPLAIRIDISDNGPGIPEALRDTLFYPLVSGHPGGHGIGLHLAHTYLLQHHGSIEFDSRPGATCFTLHLPLQAWRDTPK